MKSTEKKENVMNYNNLKRNKLTYKLRRDYFQKRRGKAPERLDLHPVRQNDRATGAIERKEQHDESSAG